MKQPKQLFAAIAAIMLCFLFAVTSAAAETDASALQADGDTVTETETAKEAEAPVGPQEGDPAEVFTLFSMGDVDLSGETDVEDVRLILREVISLEALSTEGAPYADMDGSGDIDIADARLALRVSIGLEDALRHTFTEITVIDPSSCTKTGMLSFCCAECGMAGELVIPRLPHAFVQSALTPAGCTAAGSITKVCSDCGYTTKTVLPATGHAFVKKTITAADCTSDGTAEKVCSKCGYKTAVTLPATGHEWVGGGKGQPKKCARCGIPAEGWAETDGKYRYYDENGEYVKNVIVDGYYVDDTGYRCDNAVIKQAVSYVLNYGGSGTRAQKLRNCYNRIVARSGYTRIHGFPTAASLPGKASAMFSGSSGNCYSFAAMFAYIGKVLGYPARIDSGQMMYSNGDMHYHGWTELKVSGTWYMFDAVKEKYFHIDGFMRTHERFPLYHTHGTYFTLYTQNGTAYWN